MRKKQFTTFVAIFMSVILSACVTQSFENGDTPVVQNQANRNDMAATRVSLGLGYLKMGNMSQAKQNLEKAKNFAPDMVQVYTAFAHYYETVAEPELTVKSYEKALSLKSDDADTLNNYGVYLCRQEQVEAAEKQFLKAIAVPSYILVAKSYGNLSSCFLQKDNFVKAEFYLSKAIDHSPSNAANLFQMVRLQYAMGEYRQAKLFQQRFEKVTRRFTSQSLALAFKVYTKLGQRRTAKNYAAMLVKMYPQSWEGQQYLLNELELIEPDNLAKRFQLTQVSQNAGKPKKRIVKLSPKKASSAKVTTKVEQAPPVTVESQAPKLVLTADQAAIKTTTIEVIAIPTASPDTINAALLATVIEPKTTSAAPENTKKANTEATEQLLSKPVELSTPETQVVVMKSKKTEQALATKVATETEEIVVSNTSVAIEDTEVFHVAKKPQLIVEDPAKEIVKIKVVGKTEVKPRKVLPNFHVVEKGDTLYSISVKYNIKIKALRKWNKLSKNKRLYLKDVIFVENPKLVNK